MGHLFADGCGWAYPVWFNEITDTAIDMYFLRTKVEINGNRIYRIRQDRAINRCMQKVDELLSPHYLNRKSSLKKAIASL